MQDTYRVKKTACSRAHCLPLVAPRSSSAAAGLHERKERRYLRQEEGISVQAPLAARCAPSAQAWASLPGKSEAPHSSFSAQAWRLILGQLSSRHVQLEIPEHQVLLQGRRLVGKEGGQRYLQRSGARFTSAASSTLWQSRLSTGWGGGKRAARMMRRAGKPAGGMCDAQGMPRAHRGQREVGVGAPHEVLGLHCGPAVDDNRKLAVLVGRAVGHRVQLQRTKQ